MSVVPISIDTVRLGELAWTISDKIQNAGQEHAALHHEFKSFVCIYEQLEKRMRQYFLYPEQTDQWESAMRSCEKTLLQVEKYFGDDKPLGGFIEKISYTVKSRHRLLEGLERQVKLLLDLDNLIQRDATLRRVLEDLRCDDVTIRYPMGAANYCITLPEPHDLQSESNRVDDLGQNS